MINQVCYRGIDQPEPWTLASYQKLGGYQVWQKILSGQLNHDDCLEQVKTSQLRGRGGAGFLTGIKLGFMQRSKPGQKYLVCNSDEGEPGTCKDGLILQDNPHQVLEGMLIAAWLIGADVIYNYMRGEFLIQYERMEAAVREATEAGFLGQKGQSNGSQFICHQILGAGAYIVGEETAMLESLEGKRAYPRFKPPFPAQHGLYGCPTTVSNTETLASLPVILATSGQAFSSQAKTEGGTKIFCLSGHVKTPCVVEVPLGLTFEALLNYAGGMRSDAKVKAVIPGGSSMKVLTGEEVKGLVFDYDSLQKAGSALGTGAIIVMDEHTCMVDALLNIMHFYDEESCGQCTPCREGSGWVYRSLKQIKAGKYVDLDALIKINQQVEGRTICAFGEAFTWPVTSFITKFRSEFEYFMKHGTSQVKTAHLGMSWGTV
ncbi:MAG: NADH-quinone oxidoreductase subunit NuoF [Candidatus Comchoanobacterales bacterium]